jgi:hypothetical protein
VDVVGDGYRFGMASDRELLGLVIAIYGTLAVLLAWIVHMIRTAPRLHLRGRPRTR